MAGLRAGTLEFLFTANTTDVEQAEVRVRQIGQRIERNPAEVQVTADATDALAGMDRVEEAARRVVSQDVVARVDADISQAEAEAEKIRGDLDYLRAVETNVEVSADIQRAEDRLERVDRSLAALNAARATMEVDANTAGAEEALEDIADTAGEAGEDGGEAAGGGLSSGIIAALVGIPFAGAVIGVGVAIGKSLADGISDGLQVEVRQDRLQALTGMSKEDAVILGRSAGEAYANVFGESIEANMDTARIAVQSGILDPTSTQRDSQLMIQSLGGLADVLGEEVLPISQAVTTMLRTGIVKSADEAFDVIAAGARNGVNLYEDMLEAMGEFAPLMGALGLSAEEGMGLMNQGLEGGAKNAVLIGDAIKEFQIRATDASESSAAAFEALDMNAEEMTKTFATGGQGARDGLELVIDGLNAMEDPVARNIAGQALFGSMWEDMGTSFRSLDLTNAVEQLGEVTGAAKTMFDTISGNDATKVEQARRNIEVAADGIKGALAAAFSEPLGELSDWVSSNRGPLTEFLLGLVNGAIDFGIAMIDTAANAGEAIGGFVSGPMADMVESIADALDAAANLGSVLGPLAGIVFDTGPGGDEFRALADGMREVEGAAQATADTMRTELIDNGLVPAQERLNDWGDGVISMGYLNDATLTLAKSVADLGYKSDGTKLSLEGFDGANILTATSGAALETQIMAAVAALDSEAAAAATAGEGQGELTERYNAGRDALIGQLEAMGLTAEQAQALADKYLAIPGSADTSITSNAGEKITQTDDLTLKITRLPNGSFSVSATGLENTLTQAQALNSTLNTINGKTTTAAVALKQYGQAAMAHGGVLEFMAQGGVRGLTPMAPVAQMVPASTWRVVGDRGDVPEAYIPLDGSARSMAILGEVMQRMGVTPMAAGGVTGPAAAPPAPAIYVQNPFTGEYLLTQVRVEAGRVMTGKTTPLSEGRSTW